MNGPATRAVNNAVSTPRILGSASAGQAGVIYGQINVESGAIGAGVRVEVKIGDKTYRADTDKNGLYRMNVSSPA